MNGAGQGSTLLSFLPLVALFAIFYFLIIRPQQKQQQKHKDMVNALAKGDKIITNGGLYAEVVKVDDNFIKIKLNENNIVKLDKAFVSKKVDSVNETI
ncbi:Preprotein translocase subunit YajC [Sulfurovum sp. enrichment culture clone C5]|uniref:Sec translocon accessory complex subunit YajC n=1 Tax=Sulfurovum sp. enrichment culture clone C5 TaxID=497650 RepID=A0A0S4XNB0_9BACT|nr:Preprotein translocase subunit YajC [Sulfurovum sp. enrichment culture clone C5]